MSCSSAADSRLWVYQTCSDETNSGAVLPIKPFNEKQDESLHLKVGEQVSIESDEPAIESIGQKDDDHNPIKPPDLGDQYEVEKLIGEGGMGSVWKVRDKSTGTIFAVKLLKRDLANQPLAVKRFEQECEAASMLTHTNLIAVYGHKRCPDGTPFMVMDYLEGKSLADILEDEGILPVARSLNILSQIIDALQHVHEKGLIHRDVKPSNIIVLKPEHDVDIVKLVDFGISKIAVDVRATQSLTTTIDFLGSPSYMSPEQCLGMNQDQRSDIYAFGCVMYELLTGKVLFDGASPAHVIAKHLTNKSTQISAGELPVGLRNVIETCIQSDPQDRYQNASELSEDIHCLIEAKKPKFARARTRSIKLPKTLVAVCISTLVVVSLLVSVQLSLPQVPVGVIAHWSYLGLCLSAMIFSVWNLVRKFGPSSNRKKKVIDLVEMAACLSVFFYGVILSILTCFLKEDFNSVYILFYGIFSGAICSLFCYAIFYLATRGRSYSQLSVDVFRKNNPVGYLILTMALFVLTSGSTYLGVHVFNENPFTVESEVRVQQRLALLTSVINQPDSIINPTTSTYLVERAIIHRSAGDFDKAYADLNKAIADDKTYKRAETLYRALYTRAETKWAQNDFAGAKQDLDEIINTKLPGQDRSLAYQLRGLVSLSEWEGENALRDFRATGRASDPLFICLANRMIGNEAEAKRVIDEYYDKVRPTGKNDPSSSPTTQPNWNSPALSYFHGDISVIQAVQSTNLGIDRVTVAMDLMLKGHKAAAKEIFSEQIGDLKGPPEGGFFTYCLAHSQLERLERKSQDSAR